LEAAAAAAVAISEGDKAFNMQLEGWKGA